MIITMSLGFKNILVGSQCVSIIKVSKLFDELIHQLVIFELLVVDLVSSVLDNVIKTKAVREIKLIFNFDLLVLLVLFAS